jgi:hypothetical protein
MDNFEKESEDQEEDNLTDSSHGNSFIFQFIFDEKEPSSLSHKPERNEYKIQVETNLKDPVSFSQCFTFQTSMIEDAWTPREGKFPSKGRRIPPISKGHSTMESKADLPSAWLSQMTSQWSIPMGLISVSGLISSLNLFQFIVV